MINADETVGGTSKLAPFKATYIGYKWGEPLGKATMELEQLSDVKYWLFYQSSVSKFFLSDKRTEHSIFNFQDNKVTPREYRYSRSGTGRDKKLQALFDEQNNIIAVTAKDKSYSLPWTGETDNQLFRITLPMQLAQLDKVGNTDSFSVAFLNYRGEMQQHNINIEGTENLTLPYGELTAVKVKIFRQNSSRETFAWFAPSLNFMLVRLQQFKDSHEQGDVKLSEYIQK